MGWAEPSPDIRGVRSGLGASAAGGRRLAGRSTRVAATRREVSHVVQDRRLPNRAVRRVVCCLCEQPSVTSRPNGLLLTMVTSLSLTPQEELEVVPI